MPSARGSSRPGDQTQVFCIVSRFFTSGATWEAWLGRRFWVACPLLLRRTPCPPWRCEGSSLLSRLLGFWWEKSSEGLGKEQLCAWPVMGWRGLTSSGCSAPAFPHASPFCSLTWTLSSRWPPGTQSLAVTQSDRSSRWLHALGFLVCAARPELWGDAWPLGPGTKEGSVPAPAPVAPRAHSLGLSPA